MGSSTCAASSRAKGLGFLTASGVPSMPQSIETGWRTAGPPMAPWGHSQSCSPPPAHRAPQQHLVLGVWAPAHIALLPPLCATSAAFLCQEMLPEPWPSIRGMLHVHHSSSTPLTTICGFSTAPTLPVVPLSFLGPGHGGSGQNQRRVAGHELCPTQLPHATSSTQGCLEVSAPQGRWVQALIGESLDQTGGQLPAQPQVCPHRRAGTRRGEGGL